MHDSTYRTKSTCNHVLNFYRIDELKELIRSTDGKSERFKKLALRTNSAVFMLAKLEHEEELSPSAKKCLKNTKDILLKRVYEANTFLLTEEGYTNEGN